MGVESFRRFDGCWVSGTRAAGTGPWEEAVEEVDHRAAVQSSEAERMRREGAWTARELIDMVWLRSSRVCVSVA